MRSEGSSGWLWVVLAAVWAASQYWPTTPNPEPLPHSHSIDLVSVFRTNGNTSEARHHAKSFAAICDAVAQVIEDDAKAVTPDGKTAPRLNTGRQLETLRTLTRHFAMRGFAFSSRYPTLAPTLDKWLTERLGTSAGPITADQRRKWIEAFRELAEASREAASQI